MENLPFFKRVFYRYLSLAYAFTYLTGVRTLLGASMRGWIKLLAVALLLAALLFRWGEMAVGGTAVFLFWVYFSYWRAKRAGYSKFVADDATPLPEGDLKPLPPNQKVTTWATGVFSAENQDAFLLLKPAAYWQVPLGEHIIMVRHTSRPTYLYQFFNSSTLNRVQKGWLLFGSHPRDTLAITLLSEFGPSFQGKLQSQFAFGRDKEETGIKRTIYLSFATKEDEALVWRNIARDARGRP